MFNLIHFLIILILWGVILLLIKDKETFRLHPFVPWGDTLQGCINRCQISSEQKLDQNYCETTCNNCPSKDCLWKQTQNTLLNINKDTEQSKNKFQVQAIPNDDSVLVQWTYDNSNTKKFDLYELSKNKFIKSESFTLLDNNSYNIQFMYNESTNSFKDTSSNNEIISIYQIIKNGINIPQTNNENGWFLSNEQGYLFLCSDPIHPLNSKWNVKVNIDGTSYIQYKKSDKIIHKYIFELINTDNFNNGIMIYEANPNSETSTSLKIYKKYITNLNKNTNYNLVMYPLFTIDNINKELSEIITFSTNDNKFMEITNTDT